MQPFPAVFFARVSDKMVTVTPIHLFCALCVALLIVISFFYNKLGFDGFLYPAFSGSCAGSIFLYGPDEIHVGKNSWHGCKGVLKLVELVHAHGRQTGVGQRGAEQKTVFEQRVGDVHGCPEIIVRAAVFLRVSVVGVFPENGENGCQAHGKQSVAVNDAA